MPDDRIPMTQDGFEKKRAALDCYPSQLPALEHDWAISGILDAPAPEQYWRLAPPPPGWERIADR